VASPYRKVVTICAVCGKIKGEANHWFIVDEDKDMGWLYAVYAYDEHHLDNNTVRPLMPICGVECLTRVESGLREKRTNGNV
jgi:hypothetical protein